MHCRKILGAIYKNLQALDIMPTQKNMIILLNALDGLKEVYDALGETPKKNGTSMKDVEGRDVQTDAE